MSGFGFEIFLAIAGFIIGVAIYRYRSTNEQLNAIDWERIEQVPNATLPLKASAAKPPPLFTYLLMGMFVSIGVILILAGRGDSFSFGAWVFYFAFSLISPRFIAKLAQRRDYPLTIYEDRVDLGDITFRWEHVTHFRLKHLVLGTGKHRQERFLIEVKLQHKPLRPSGPPRYHFTISKADLSIDAANYQERDEIRRAMLHAYQRHHRQQARTPSNW